MHGLDVEHLSLHLQFKMLKFICVYRFRENRGLLQKTLPVQFNKYSVSSMQAAPPCDLENNLCEEDKLCFLLLIFQYIYFLSKNKYLSQKICLYMILKVSFEEPICNLLLCQWNIFWRIHLQSTNLSKSGSFNFLKVFWWRREEERYRETSSGMVFVSATVFCTWVSWRPTYFWFVAVSGGLVRTSSWLF